MRTQSVHLAARLADSDAGPARSSPFRAWGLDLLPEWSIVAVVTVLTAARVLAGTGAGPRRLEIGIVFVFPLCLLGAIAWTRSLARRTTISSEHPLRSDPSYRLRVVGWAQELHRAEEVIRRAAATNGQDVSEPEVFRLTLASEPRPRLVLRAGVCALAAIAVLLLLQMIFRPAVQVLTVVDMFIVAGIARVIWGAVWPTSVRIVPGRVDLLRWPALGAGRPTVQSIDLRSARALIDLRYGRIFLHPEDAARGEWLSGVAGAPVRLGREMGLAVLAAALSSFNAPSAAELDAVDEVAAR